MLNNTNEKLQQIQSKIETINERLEAGRLYSISSYDSESISVFERTRSLFRLAMERQSFYAHFFKLLALFCIAVAHLIYMQAFLDCNLVYKDDIFPVGRSRCEKIQEALDKLLRLLECDAESLMFISNVGAGLCGDFVFRDPDGMPIQAFTSNKMTDIDDESIVVSRITPEPGLILVVETKGVGNNVSTSVFQHFPSAMIVKTTGMPNVALRCLLKKIAGAHPNAKFHAFTDLNLGGYRIFNVLQLGNFTKNSVGTYVRRGLTSNKFKLGGRIDHVGIHPSQVEGTGDEVLLRPNPELNDDDKIASFQADVNRLVARRAECGYEDDYESEQLESLRDNLYCVQAEYSNQLAISLVMDHLHAQYPEEHPIHHQPTPSSPAQSILVIQEILELHQALVAGGLNSEADDFQRELVGLCQKYNGKLSK